MGLIHALRSRGASADGPVVVGGVGGSGTRVVAGMLRDLRVYTGSDLSAAGDNLWFTLLCKLPRWELEGPAAESEDLARSFETLERAMTGRLTPERDDREWIDGVVTRCTTWWQTDRLPDDEPPEWLRARASSLRRSRRRIPSRTSLWGWKEPNSHVLLPSLQQHFGDRLRYVHVIRNGLNMAYSRNQSQAQRWGAQYGIPSARPPGPVAALDYWLEANSVAIARGRAMPSASFLLLNYDELCTTPLEGVGRLVDFVGLHPSGQVVRRLVDIPREPGHRHPPVGELQEVFGAERLERVRELGFSLEGAA